MSRKVAVIFFVLVVTSVLAAPKVAITGPCNDTSVSDAMKKALAPQGYRVTLEDGSTIEVWPAAELQTSNKARQDATYLLSPSTLFGVIHFAKSTRDCRGNTIPAGTYNLRYQLQPNDGDHLGTSPTPDFLLLVPPAVDTDPAQTYSFDQLVRLSAQVTGKRHPAPLNLVPADAAQLPSVITDSEDHTVLFLKLKTQSGELPLGLVVKGTAPE